MLVVEMIAKGINMKNKLKEFAQFLFRCVLAGIVILICAGIIYGMWGLSALTGIAPKEDYTFWNQYVQAGFWIGFFAIVKDLKEFWR